jgi:hypothetical protein
MHCVNHPGTDAQSFCQNCGKPLCADCVRKTASGQILCEPCVVATGGDPSQAYWQGAGQVPPGGVPPGSIPPFYIPSSGPNPSVAAVLGLIPGVGAMYNGQLFKGLIHVVIFAVLVSITDHYGIFGLFIGGWVLYQSFEAYHTAKARRDGTPIPDPFGLNELGSWLNLGMSGKSAQQPNPPPPGTGYGQNEPPYGAPYPGSWGTPTADPSAVPGSRVSGSAGPVPSQPPYSEPYAGPGQEPYPYAENYPPGFVPPIPPVPPMGWRRKEPIFAFVLIGLGIIFLLQSMGFMHHLMHYLWPLMLIGLGVWLVIRRVGYTQGGSK